MTVTAGAVDPEVEAEERSRAAFDAMLHRPAFWAVLGVGLLAAIAVIALSWLHAQRFVSTDDAFVDADVVHVSSEMAGRLTSVLVDEDALVRKGQVIATLNPSQAEAKLAQSNSARNAALGDLAQALAQPKIAEASVDLARAAIEGKQAQLEAAQGDLARLSQLRLVSPAAVSQQQVEDAKTATREAGAQLAVAQGQVRLAQAQLTAARAQASIARGQLGNAEAQQQQGELNLSYTEIVAPQTGHVAQKLAAPGDMVQAGQQLLSIVPTKIWVVANLKETQLHHVRPGQVVDIRFDAYPQIDFKGHVASIRYGAGQAFSLLPSENATGNFVKVVQRVPVRILLDAPVDAAHPLGPGMSAHPTIHVQ